jgi:leader peptidase (prepilin peptidase) / N-methyltransferase
MTTIRSYKEKIQKSQYNATGVSMDNTWTIIFGIIGCLVGLIIPKISIKIIEKKLANKSISRKPSLLDRKPFFVLMVCANGVLWGITSSATTSNILEAGIIGVLATLALLFTVIDLSIHIIPNELLIVTGVFAIAFQLVAFDFKHLLIALVCMVVIFGIFLVLGLIIGLHKIGAGDVKLAGIMGLVLGFPNILNGILIMAVALLTYCVVGITIGKLTHVSMFPFAPFLMLGMIGALGLILFPVFALI